jgi:hypothetical protein
MQMLQLFCMTSTVSFSNIVDLLLTKLMFHDRGNVCCAYLFLSFFCTPSILSLSMFQPKSKLLEHLCRCRCSNCSPLDFYCLIFKYCGDTLNRFNVLQSWKCVLCLFISLLSLYSLRSVFVDIPTEWFDLWSIRFSIYYFSFFFGEGHIPGAGVTIKWAVAEGQRHECYS